MPNPNPQPDKSEKLIRGVGSAVAYFRLAKAAMFSAVWTFVAVVFWLQGVPYYYVLPALAVPVLVMALEIVALRRLNRVDLSAPQSTQRAQADPHEKLLGTVAGVMPIEARGGYATLGTGSIKATENALVVTDKKIYAVTVPVAGAGKIVAGQDVSMWQWMLGGGQIRTKLDAIAQGKTLQQLLDAVTVNHAHRKTQVEFQDDRRTLAIDPLAHASARYSILSPTEYQKAKNLFDLKS